MTESTIEKREIKAFLDKDNSTLNTFRTLTLFGKNAATYKFALCHALLNQNGQNSELRYEDLKEDFLRELVRHYENNPHQFSRRENSLTREIDLYLASDKTTSDWTKLSAVAGKNIFNDVFRAYQNVGSGTLANSHLLFEDQRTHKKITMTDRLLSVLENPKAKQIINHENQARWHIVEEAWRSGLAANMLSYNKEDGLFYSENENLRIGLRSAVDTLLPYQNGRCFYCNREVSKFVLSHCDDFADVDHFFPISMVSRLGEGVPNPNGVWNLVIACKKCNRGQDGKFDAPPTREYYESLVTRNILFFEEHKHSLKNAISLSLNAKNKLEIISRMQNVYHYFKPLAGWQPAITFHVED
ncbi:HNH endonuclease [Photobacterium leiognathi]|uniref:HNH endonuclease n=1 Tax=Photobacterium leiognathi TaxID=553611 RepID=UPI0029810E2F|nr:HNH endonuclease domain-containing protein [Photobacterium leiognathi]